MIRAFTPEHPPRCRASQLAWPGRPKAGLGGSQGTQHLNTLSADQARFGIAAKESAPEDPYTKVFKQAQALYGEITGVDSLVPQPYRALMPPLIEYADLIRTLGLIPDLRFDCHYVASPKLPRGGAVVVNPAVYMTDTFDKPHNALRAHLLFNTILAVDHLRMMHWQAHDPEGYKQARDHHVLKAIEAGEASPLVMQGPYYYTPEQSKGPFDLPRPQIEALSQWLMAHPFRQPDQYLQRTGKSPTAIQLSATGLYNAQRTMPEPLWGALEQASQQVGQDMHTTVEQLVRYHLLANQYQYVAATWTPPMSGAFRQHMAPFFHDVAKDNAMFEESVWARNPALNHEAKRRLNTLLDAEAAQGFLAQYPDRNLAEEVLTQYAISLNRRLSFLRHRDSNTVPQALMTRLKQLPLSEALRQEATTVAQQTWDHTMASELRGRSAFGLAGQVDPRSGQPDPLPLYTLAYHLLNGGARRARRLSAQYYLTLPDTPNQDRLQNDLRLLDALDELAHLWPELERAEKTPFAYQQPNTYGLRVGMPGQIPFCDDVHTGTGLLKLAAITQSALDEMRRRLDVNTLIAESPQTDALKTDALDAMINVAALMPKCTEQLQTAWHDLKLLADEYFT
ncbi:MAG: hypothetical protein KC474_06825 [Cyanobacteria bacterium HKST-UBA04]|nr:hypothetical protein [Cyanobacteria bacterium HKST-UBA04]